MTAFFRDLRYGWRSLRRAPWYALSVTGVLAVGLTLTTVAFAVADGVPFRPLPFVRADELYLLRADASRVPHLARARSTQHAAPSTARVSAPHWST
jgi:hypothetical protein